MAPRSKGNDMLTNVEEVILMSLVGQERYGLDIIQQIAQAHPAKKHISVGTLYPALSRLEKRGLVTLRHEERQVGSRSGARRKYYRITIAGTRALHKMEALREHLEAQLSYGTAPA
jgi:DNA-binding PadR family transcriptional regulator